MKLQWWALIPTLVFVSVSIASYYIREAERQTGKALLGVAFPPGLSSDRYPFLFKLRLASYWLLIGFGALAALAFLVQFLGFAR
jgi:hypothetical protein